MIDVSTQILPISNYHEDLNLVRSLFFEWGTGHGNNYRSLQPVGRAMHNPFMLLTGEPNDLA